MTERLRSGSHPDADVLSAFIEGVLPEHERNVCAAHFSQCSRCREIVFLAQPSDSAVQAPVFGRRRRWFGPLAGFASAAAACALIVGIVMSRYQVPVTPVDTAVPAAVTTERLDPGNVPTGTARTVINQGVGLPRKRTVQPTDRTRYADETSPQKIQTAASRVPMAKLPEARSAKAPSTPLMPLLLPKEMVKTEPKEAPAARPLIIPFVQGSVVDPTGAAIGGAKVTLQAEGTPDGGITTQADSSGHYLMSGMAAGNYVLRVESSGFQVAESQVNVNAEGETRVVSTLQVGSMAQTVEVAGATLSRRQKQTPSMVVAAQPAAAKLPIVVTASNKNRVLSVDSAGQLFFSKDGGLNWRLVAPTWEGKVVEVVALPPHSRAKAEFQLTTESGSIWISRDGLKWQQ